jgi:hypothetical protein
MAEIHTHQPLNSLVYFCVQDQQVTIIFLILRETGVYPIQLPETSRDKKTGVSFGVLVTRVNRVG